MRLPAQKQDATINDLFWVRGRLSTVLIVWHRDPAWLLQFTAEADSLAAFFIFSMQSSGQKQECAVGYGVCVIPWGGYRGGGMQQ